MTASRRVTSILLSMAFFGALASAKDLEGRVGVGAAIPDFDGMGALSIRYHPSRYFGLQGLLGFSTQDGVNATVVGAKLHRNAYLEENMNFYVGLGGMIIADRASALVTTGIEIDALFGAEFFFSGLPNLGLQFETGVGIRSQRGTYLRTLGNGLSSLGIHYYF
jgi:hypothetical protein